MFKYSMLAICCFATLAQAASTADNELMNKKQLEISRLSQYLSIGRGIITKTPYLSDKQVNCIRVQILLNELKLAK